MKKIAQGMAAIASLSILLAAPLSHAQLKPLWEAGAGFAPLRLPNYRGSDQSQTYVFPFPYFVYRGEYLKADRNGVRGVMFESERVEVELSLNGSLPVSSKDTPARSGMADLRPTVEIGPTLNVNLWNAGGKGMKLDLRAPLRTAITIESSPRQIGWLFSPSLNLDIRDPGGYAGWNLGIQTGPVFGNRKYHSYFYSVGSSDATAMRPAYSAAGGYSGSQLTFAVSKRFPRYWVGSFLRYDNLSGAAFEDSPLVRQQSAVSAGFAIAWIFGQSSTMVKVDE